MSAIDIQNAKQIRDPMDVVISMTFSEDVAVTYSNRTNVKIYDDKLDQRGWPMRTLADLQGDGFALNGSAVLYDSTVSPSASNGKIGIRGNVGETLSVTVNGDSTIAGLSIMATGTNAVTFNGTTTELVDGELILPIGVSTARLSFAPASATRRVELSLLMPGTSLVVTNEDIISCTVSLRSDLSIENPTLPESELNVDVYYDTDISEAVAAISEDTPITYSAGYPNDMSPERKFYISEQVTWADNVLSIHAVDAVHFLDKEVPPRINENEHTWFFPTLSYLTAVLAYNIVSCGVEFGSKVRGYYQADSGKSVTECCVLPRGTARELVAFAMNVLRFKDLSNETTPYMSGTGTHNFLLTYVDAGAPFLRTDNFGDPWSINEDDCGNVARKVEPKIGAITVEHLTESHNAAYSPDERAGSVTFVKDGGSFVQIENQIASQMRFMFNEGDLEDTAYSNGANALPSTAAGAPYATQARDDVALLAVDAAGRVFKYTFQAGYWLFDDETPQSVTKDRRDGSTIYTQIVPQDAYFDTGWNYPLGNSTEQLWAKLADLGYVDGDAENCEVPIYGNIVNYGQTPLTFSTGDKGNTIEIEEKLHGRIVTSDKDRNPLQTAYPDLAYENLLNRSNITGSFTWKGDPRMQPRDVVEFHRLDGTVEEITLENITLHHEGGGTYAEITYRKGVC